jgi:hypothetical protein
VSAVPRKKSPVALRQTVPAYGGTSWDEVEASMLESPSDRFRLERLEQALRDEGRFVDPVLLDPDDLSVIDGMHRVVASLRTGVAIDVSFTSGEECPVTELREVHLRVEVNDALLAAAWAEGDEPIELSAAVNALSSIPHDDGWIGAAVFAALDGRLDATWSPHAGSRMPEDERLTEILVERASAAGLRLTVLSISHHPWWLDDEA